MAEHPNVPPLPPQPQGASRLKWLLIGGGGCLVLLIVLLIAFVGCAALLAPPEDTGGGGAGGAGAGDEGEAREAREGRGTGIAIVEVGGTEGMRFSGTISGSGNTRSVDGVTPARFEAEYDPDPYEYDTIYVDFYKDTGAGGSYPEGTLEVSIVVDGETVQEGSSSADDGYVSLSWSPE